jgi:predicted alpha/beta-fold hydrolase
MFRNLSLRFHRLNYGGLISKYVYSRALGDNLLKIAKLHSKTIRTWVGHPISTALDAVLGLNRPTLEEFDTEFTRIAGGYVKPHGPFPFDTAWDYYTWASSLHMLPDVRVPFLAISSTDDPVVQRVPTQAGGNGYVALSLTAGGGHLGWFESDGLWKTKRWINRPVLEWLRAVGEDLIYGGPTGPEIYEESGFLKEVGREHFGCKEVEGGGFVVGLDKKPGSLLQGL